MNRTVKLFTAALSLAGTAVLAYPEGAPWGAADPGAAENCGSCHYDYDPLFDSPTLSIEGLPEAVEPRKVYDLVVRLADVDAAVAGFQLLAVATAGEAGAFRSDDETVEALGAASRSVRPATLRDGASWTLTWRAPDEVQAPLQLYLAVSAANDDQSPFGDTIHYGHYVIPPSR